MRGSPKPLPALEKKLPPFWMGFTKVTFPPSPYAKIGLRLGVMVSARKNIASSMRHLCEPQGVSNWQSPDGGYGGKDAWAA